MSQLVLMIIVHDPTTSKLSLLLLVLLYSLRKVDHYDECKKRPIRQQESERESERE